MGARQEGARSGRNGGKNKWKSSEVNTRAVSRGQNELIRRVQDDGGCCD